ncbi:MAG: single-stranded DNA-binding protein [Bacteroidales bacterium]|nr:single-stranded DNA-binding protein [Bacteroidales bacterium]
MEHQNRVELRGIVGSVKVQTFSEDRKLAKIRLVTVRAYKSRDGEPVIEETWHNITAWEGREVQNLESIKRGDPLHVVGRMRSQKYTAADGSERNTYDISANTVELIRVDGQLQYER